MTRVVILENQRLLQPKSWNGGGCFPDDFPDFKWWIFTLPLIFRGVSSVILEFLWKMRLGPFLRTGLSEIFFPEDVRFSFSKPVKDTKWLPVVSLSCHLKTLLIIGI